jgi:uncharacterized protein
MIYNLTKRTVLARRPVTALGFLPRARGMIGRRFGDFDAMVFNHCRCIHTLGMSMAIDVVFVDRENRICALRQELVPWLPLVGASRAMSVIELPAGAITRSGTETGDVIDLNAELTETARKALAGKSMLQTAEIIASCRKN